MGKIEMLVFPPALEPIGRQLRVPHGVLDVPMPEVGLQPSRIETPVGQSVSASVTQHVWMRLDV